MMDQDASQTLEISDEHLVSLLKEPDNLHKWIQTIKAIEEANDGLSKKSPQITKKLLSSIYSALLNRFPNLENYWILSAEWAFKLGDTPSALNIYTDSLKTLPYSLKIWVEYIKFRIGLSNFTYLELKTLFKFAELRIGSHYHSSEFWDLYLLFEENYNLSPKNQKYEIFLILRKLIEIPIHNYAKFYQRFIRFIEEELDLSNVLAFVNQNDLNKVGLQSADKLKTVANSEDKELIESTVKELKVRIKKVFTDLYIANQYEVFKIYQYESKLKRQYFHITKLTEQELGAWDAYLTYLEIKLIAARGTEGSNANNSKNSVIYKNLLVRLKLTYERCLITTALYDRFWIRYFWLFVSLNQYSDAKNVLARSFYYLPVSTLSTKLLLVNLENFNGKHFNARDYLMKLLTKFAECPEVWKHFVNHENLLFGYKGDSSTEYVLDLMDEKLQNVIASKKHGQNKESTDENGDMTMTDQAESNPNMEDETFDIFFRFLLSYDNISLSRKLEFFEKYENTLYTKSSNYWLPLIKLLTFNHQQLEFHSSDEKATKVTGGFESETGTPSSLLANVTAKPDQTTPKPKTKKKDANMANDNNLSFSFLRKVYFTAKQRLQKDRIAITKLSQFYESLIFPLYTENTDELDPAELQLPIGDLLDIALQDYPAQKEEFW